MGGKVGGASANDVVYVVLERGVAMDLLNALYIALGIVPGGGKTGGIAGGKDTSANNVGGKAGAGKGGSVKGGSGKGGGGKSPGSGGGKAPVGGGSGKSK